MNEYFLNFADETKRCLEIPVEFFHVKINSRTVSILHTDQAHISNLLELFFCSKSSVEGYVFISKQMLNLVAPVLAQPVTYLTNRCLSEGVFPNFFKTAKVLPICKSGDIDAVQNYRPVSIFPSPEEVFGEFIFTQFCHLLSTNHII